MYSLILLVVLGMGMAYFSTQNIVGVPLTIANYTFTNIPLYLIVIGSLLLGVVISFLINMVQSLSSMMQMQRKNTDLTQAKQMIRTLEIENAKLRGEHSVKKSLDTHTVSEEEVIQQPSFLNRLRHAA